MVSFKLTKYRYIVVRISIHTHTHRYTHINAVYIANHSELFSQITLARLNLNHYPMLGQLMGSIASARTTAGYKAAAARQKAIVLPKETQTRLHFQSKIQYPNTPQPHYQDN